jgi:serine/threonine protein kinase
MTGPINRRLTGVDKTQRLSMAVDLLVLCAEALTEVHDLRIIHRDVKPANFLYEMVYMESKKEEICQVKIADFGCAVQLHPDVDTTTGNTGTRSYKAPEVSLSQNYSQRADVYSFGVMVWELVYTQRRSSQIRRAFKLVANEYTSREEYAENVCTPPCTGKFGSHIDAVIRQCTDKIPSNRPHMKTVTATLKKLHRERKIHEIHEIPNSPSKKITPTKTKKRFQSVLSN